MEKSRLTTLCYIEKDDRYLMLHRIRKEKDVNKDKWIGVGGHFEEGESPEECLIREVKEETGLTITAYRFRGLITFTAAGYPTEYMCLYTADQFFGEETSCDEGVLEWVEKSKIKDLNLWEGDRIFLKLLREEQPFFSLKLTYDKDRLTEAVLNGCAMELLDIRLPGGEVTGQVRERSVAHEDGTLHGTAHVWILKKKKDGFEILLQKRSQDKDSWAGCYDISSAGHIPAGSGFLESAIRELEEELGIFAEPEELIFLGMHDGYSRSEFYGRPFYNHEISAVYVYEKEIDAAKLLLQESEVESVCWMDFSACLKEVREHSPDYCIFEDELKMVGQYLGEKTGSGIQNSEWKK